MQRLSGKNFDVYLGDMLVHVESASLDIEDSSEVAKTTASPTAGRTGKSGQGGEIEVDAREPETCYRGREKRRFVPWPP